MKSLIIYLDNITDTVTFLPSKKFSKEAKHNPAMERLTQRNTIEEARLATRRKAAELNRSFTY